MNKKTNSLKVYQFIRLCLGDDVSDRHISRVIDMPWRSFMLLKHGERREPRVDTICQIARALHVPPALVFQIAAGNVSPKRAMFSLKNEDHLYSILLFR